MPGRCVGMGAFFSTLRRGRAVATGTAVISHLFWTIGETPETSRTFSCPTTPRRRPTDRPTARCIAPAEGTDRQTGGGTRPRSGAPAWQTWRAARRNDGMMRRVRGYTWGKRAMLPLRLDPQRYWPRVFGLRECRAKARSGRDDGRGISRGFALWAPRGLLLPPPFPLPPSIVARVHTRLVIKPSVCPRSCSNREQDQPCAYTATRIRTYMRMCICAVRARESRFLLIVRRPYTRASTPMSIVRLENRIV